MPREPNADKNNSKSGQPSEIWGLKNHGAFARLKENNEPVQFRLIITVFGKTLGAAYSIVYLNGEKQQKTDFTTEKKELMSMFVTRLKSLFYEDKFDYFEWRDPEGTQEEIFAKVGEWAAI